MVCAPVRERLRGQVAADGAFEAPPVVPARVLARRAARQERRLFGHPVLQRTVPRVPPRHRVRHRDDPRQRGLGSPLGACQGLRRRRLPEAVRLEVGEHARAQQRRPRAARVEPLGFDSLEQRGRLDHGGLSRRVEQETRHGRAEVREADRDPVVLDDQPAREVRARDRQGARPQPGVDSASAVHGVVEAAGARGIFREDSGRQDVGFSDRGPNGRGASGVDRDGPPGGAARPRVAALVAGLEGEGDGAGRSRDGHGRGRDELARGRAGHVHRKRGPRHVVDDTVTPFGMVVPSCPWTRQCQHACLASHRSSSCPCCGPARRRELPRMSAGRRAPAVAEAAAPQCRWSPPGSSASRCP